MGVTPASAAVANFPMPPIGSDAICHTPIAGPATRAAIRLAATRTEVPEAEKIPTDLSSYVNFLHPWGNIILDPFVLMLMFFGLVIATLITLRAQDIL